MQEANLSSNAGWIKMEMTRGKYWIAAGSGAVLLLFGYYLFFYRPLTLELGKKARESREIENLVTAAHVHSLPAGHEGDEDKLISEESVSTAIEELTAQGKIMGINFLSIASRQREHAEGKAYSVLPIEMELESSYEALGRFLGSLEGLHRCLVTARTFESLPANNDPSKLKTRLTVNLYLSEK